MKQINAERADNPLHSVIIPAMPETGGAIKATRQPTAEPSRLAEYVLPALAGAVAKSNPTPSPLQKKGNDNARNWLISKKVCFTSQAMVKESNGK